MKPQAGFLQAELATLAGPASQREKHRRTSIAATTSAQDDSASMGFALSQVSEKQETWGTHLYNSVVVQALESEIHCARAQLFFNAEQLVVFRNTVGAARRSGLDLTHTCRNREVGNECVLALARTM